MKTLLAAAALLLGAAPLTAQVAFHPATTSPAAWERLALRVINQTDTATVQVRVEVPEAIAILGVERAPGWREFRIIPQTATSPAAIEWRGGSLGAGEFQEFAFLGRPKADARQEDLVFPVRITRANGSVVEWRRGPGEPYAAPRVRIVTPVGISPRGLLMLSGGAVGVALALVVTIARSARRTA